MNPEKRPSAFELKNYLIRNIPVRLVDLGLGVHEIQQLVGRYTSQSLNDFALKIVASGKDTDIRDAKLAFAAAVRETLPNHRDKADRIAELVQELAADYIAPPSFTAKASEPRGGRGNRL